MRSRIKAMMYLLLVPLLSAFATAQTGAQFRTLVVNEHSGKVALFQMDDKTYIDLNQFVQIAHGSIDYRTDQIVLTLPGPSSGATVAMPEPQGPKDSALTRDFMKAAIEGISLMREWASNLANDIQNGYPVSENWVSGYRARAQNGLAMAAAAASSDADRSGYELLNREFDAVQEWSNKLLQARKSMDAAKYAISDSALQNDPLSQKIVTCGRFLGQMLASGTFQDDSSCH
jgi:hypothetical protein